MSEKELVKKEITAVSGVIQQGRGFEEGVNRDELLIPRAKLLQALSPECTSGKFSPGRIINSMTQEELPSEFIPVFKFTNWCRFNPRDPKSQGYNPSFQPGALVWRSANPSDPRVITEAKFGENGERPLATQFINFFSFFPGVDMPVVVSFCNTSIKAGKQLISLAKFLGGDLFSRKYSLKTKQVQNTMGTFFVLEVASIGAPNENEFKTAEMWWEEFHSKELKIHEEETDVTSEDRPF